MRRRRRQLRLRRLARPEATLPPGAAMRAPRRTGMSVVALERYEFPRAMCARTSPPRCSTSAGSDHLIYLRAGVPAAAARHALRRARAAQCCPASTASTRDFAQIDWTHGAVAEVRPAVDAGPGRVAGGQRPEATRT
jgi:hypothetical protein